MAVGGLTGLVTPRYTSGQTQPPPANSLNRLALHEAVVKWQNAWGRDLSYDAALLDGKWTRWVEPERVSAEEDLRALLQGTGLSLHRLSSGTLSLKRNVAPVLRGSLSGYVLDQMQGTPLPRAHVWFENTTRGAATNAFGRFALDALDPGVYALLVTHVGYASKPVLVEIQPGQHSEIFVELRIKPTALLPIIIDSERAFDATVPYNTLSADAVNQISGLGTADLIHNINTLPGVRVGDATSEVHIQGGDRGEHQFLLDGALIFEPVHLFGLVGAFNPFAVSRITVDKAGFSASKGSYLAGVISAEHALTDTDNHPLDVQIDPLSLNVRLNLSAGQSEGMHGEFMAAVRRSTWDSYLSALRSATIDSMLLDRNEPDAFLLRASLYPLKALNLPAYERYTGQLDTLPEPAIPDMSFNDIHLAGRVRFKNTHMVHGSYYRGGNQLRGRRLITALDTTTYDQPNLDQYDWINENAQLRWTALPTANVFVATRLRSSLYRLNHEYSALDRQNARTVAGGARDLFGLVETEDANRIRESVLESALDYSHRGGYLHTGFELINSKHRFIISDVFSRSIIHRESAWRMAFFAEEKLTAIPRVTITGSGRVTYLDSRATFYAEPRLELRYTAPLGSSAKVSVRGAGGVYYQFLNQFEISTISPTTLFPSTRFWMPVDETIAPPKAYHLAADVGLQFARRWMFRAEGYYKDQPRLYRIDYPSLWIKPESEEIEDIPITRQADFIEEAEGYAYGSAFILERAGRTLRTEARYEYNVAKRDYAFRDSVRLEPVPWSEPHRLEFALDWTPHPNFIATARWRGGWGRIWGFRQAYYDFLATDVSQGLTFDEFDFRDPTGENHRLPSFQQLDLGVAYTQPIGPTAIQLRVDVLNVTDRDNVADLSLIEEGEGNALHLVSQKRFLLPRTLSVSVRLKW